MRAPLHSASSRLGHRPCPRPRPPQPGDPGNTSVPWGHTSTDNQQWLPGTALCPPPTPRAEPRHQPSSPLPRAEPAGCWSFALRSEPSPLSPTVSPPQGPTCRPEDVDLVLTPAPTSQGSAQPFPEPPSSRLSGRALPSALPTTARLTALVWPFPFGSQPQCWGIHVCCGRLRDSAILRKPTAVITALGAGSRGGRAPGGCPGCESEPLKCSKQPHTDADPFLRCLSAWRGPAVLLRPLPALFVHSPS